VREPTSNRRPSVPLCEDLVSPRGPAPMFLSPSRHSLHDYCELWKGCEGVLEGTCPGWDFRLWSSCIRTTVPALHPSATFLWVGGGVITQITGGGNLPRGIQIRGIKLRGNTFTLEFSPIGPATQ